MNWLKTATGYESACGNFKITRRAGGDFDVFHFGNTFRLNDRCCSLKAAKQAAADWVSAIKEEFTSATKPTAVLMPAAESRTPPEVRESATIPAPHLFTKGESRKYRKTLRKYGLSFPRQGSFVVVDRTNGVIEPKLAYLTNVAYGTLAKDGTFAKIRHTA